MVVAKKRILFIANEMSPYLELTEFAETVNKLAIKSNDNGFEVRCIMPRFGVINERRHRLHEVVAFPESMFRSTMTTILCRLKWLPCPMPGYRFISWKTKIFSNVNIFSTMRRRNGLTIMVCVQFSFAKEPWKP